MVILCYPQVEVGPHEGLHPLRRHVEWTAWEGLVEAEVVEEGVGRGRHPGVTLRGRP